MVKQIIAYLVLSLLVVMFAQYAHLLIVYIAMGYTYIAIKITPLFNMLEYGEMIRNVCLLVIIPVIVVGIPALIYRVLKGRKMPGFIELVWILWLIMVLGKVLIR